jgi:hypothetical protein
LKQDYHQPDDAIKEVSKVKAIMIVLPHYFLLSLERYQTITIFKQSLIAANNRMKNMMMDERWCYCY